VSSLHRIVPEHQGQQEIDIDLVGGLNHLIEYQ
jgi:hypothetical protein